MKKVLAGIIIVLAVSGYLWWSMRSPATFSIPVPVGYKDGTYTGDVANSIYGPVQVAIAIAGGKIVTVDVPVYPNTPGHTTEVSNESIPVLKQEAIAVQSAKVDIVSGATQTVEAFQESLASALSQAS